jgi:hypothetical protein
MLLLMSARSCARWHDSYTRHGCLYTETSIGRHDAVWLLRLIALLDTGRHLRSRGVCRVWRFIPRRLHARAAARHCRCCRHAWCRRQGVVSWSRCRSRSMHGVSTMVHSWRWSMRRHVWRSHARLSADAWMTRVRRMTRVWRDSRMTWRWHTWVAGRLLSSVGWCVARCWLWRWRSVGDANIHRLEGKLWTSAEHLAHLTWVRIEDTITQDGRRGIVT